jgi:CubicO group peptidase (beta-lactamase class C family)
MIPSLLPTLITRARVPKSLDEVTSFGEPEIDPLLVDADPARVDAAWRAVESLYRSGIHPAIQLCVRRRGHVLIDRAIGYARGAGPTDAPGSQRVLATPDSPFNIFSASKAVTAMVIHLLDQKHLIHLDDPICEYIPEFGVHAKQWITIRHVLTHRAGMPNLPPDAMNLDFLAHPKSVIEILCRSRPTWRPGHRLAYHAISGGFILGEVVQRVTGMDIRAYITREIRRPLGFRWMSYGVEWDEVDQVATNYFTGPAVLPPLSTLLGRALGVGFQEAIALSNDERFLTGIVPSANIVATANELCRFYQLLLNGGQLDGVRIFDPRTIRRATSEQSYLEVDFTLGLPLRYGMGFMLGGKWFSLYGIDTERTFGHLGFTNIVSWADPARQVAGALMTNGKPVLYPEIIHAFDILRQIALACPKEANLVWPPQATEVADESLRRHGT